MAFNLTEGHFIYTSDQAGRLSLDALLGGNNSGHTPKELGENDQLSHYFSLIKINFLSVALVMIDNLDH